MATIIFFTRPSKKYTEKRTSVYVRLRDGRKLDLTAKTELELFPKEFSNETHTIKQRAKHKQQDKKYLADLENEILEAYKDIKVPPTSEWLNNIIDKYRFPDKYKQKNITFFSFIQSFIEDAPTRIVAKTGRPVTYKTIRDYTKTYEDLKSFAAFTGHNFDFKDVNKNFYNDFISFLTIRKTKANPNGLTKNTIGKKIKVLKTFLNAATPAFISSDQYRGFKTLTEESQNIYLTPEELQEIYQLDLSDKLSLEKTRDLFIVGCWTGLRYSDWNKIAPENIKGELITIFQEKTGQKVVVPIHPTVRQILNKYDGDLPKTISNQKFNAYLKQITKLVKLNQSVSKQITRAGKKETILKKKWEMVTTHTARRSFATNMYKAGVPSITIMAITGHRTESVFLKYIKVTLEEHANKMREIWANMVSL